MSKLSPGKYPLLPVIVLPCGAWSQGAAAGQCCAEEEGWLDGVSRAPGCVCTGQPSIRLLIAQGQVSSISTTVAAEPSLLFNEGRGRAWSSPSTRNTSGSLQDLPAAPQSTSHRRFCNSSWKAFQNSSLSFKHSPKTIIKTRENLVRNDLILSCCSNWRKMFRIRLIIGVLSAGYFLHNLIEIFSPAFFSCKINTIPACSCHHAISFKQGFKDLFLEKMNH